MTTRRPCDLPERLGTAIHYLESQLGEELDFGEAARRARFSRSHFMRVFRAITGFPVAEYVRRRRLSRAARALESGRPVLETAIEWGYESQAAFTRAFARTFGVTPGAHARRARQGGTALEVLDPFEIAPARVSGVAGVGPTPAAFRATGVVTANAGLTG